MSQVPTTTGTLPSGAEFINQMSHDWQGGMASNENGSFKHVGNQNGSQGAVLYQVKSSSGADYRVVLAWLNPPNTDNKAFTEVLNPGPIPADYWVKTFDKLYKSNGNSASDSKGGITSNVRIDQGGDSPKFSATITVA